MATYRKFHDIKFAFTKQNVFVVSPMSISKWKMIPTNSFNNLKHCDKKEFDDTLSSVHDQSIIKEYRENC